MPPSTSYSGTVHSTILYSCSYAFRSPEKVALQEIGPRFTLKLRYIKKGLPAVKNLGAPSKPLQFDDGEAEPQDADMPDAQEQEQEAANSSQNYPRKEVVPPTEDEYLWMWKVRDPTCPKQYIGG